PDGKKRSPFNQNNVDFQLILYGRSPRFRWMEFVKLSIEPFVDDIVGGCNTYRCGQAEPDRNSQRFRMSASKQIGEHDAGNDEDLFGAVVKAGHGQVGQSSCLQRHCSAVVLVHGSAPARLIFLIMKSSSSKAGGMRSSRSR